MTPPLDKDDLDFLLYLVRKDYKKLEKRRETIVPLGDQSPEHFEKTRENMQLGLMARRRIVARLADMRRALGE